MNTLLPWALAVGIVTVRDVRVYHRAPVPSEFVATGVLFAGLTVLAQGSPELATALAWGLLAAVVLKGAPSGGITARRVPAQEAPTRGGR